MKVLFLIILLNLAGCISSPPVKVFDYRAAQELKKFEEKKESRRIILNTWIGRTKKELIDKWGHADLIVKALKNDLIPEGTPFILYSKSVNIPIGGYTVYHDSYQYGFIDDTPYNGIFTQSEYVPTSVLPSIASIRFIINKDDIISSVLDEPMVYSFYEPIFSYFPH